MCVGRRSDTKRTEERDMLGGVREMILAADDVRDFHFQVVYHIDEMEDRLAVAADDHEIRVVDFPVAQRAGDGSGNQIRNGDRVAGHSEPEGSVAFIRMTRGAEFGGAALVNLGPLGLKIRTFVPVEPEPLQSVEDGIE